MDHLHCSIPLNSRSGSKGRITLPVSRMVYRFSERRADLSFRWIRAIATSFRARFPLVEVNHSAVRVKRFFWFRRATPHSLGSR